MKFIGGYKISRLEISLESLPSSVAEARTMGSKHYFTGKPCKHGHVTYRWTAHGTCAGCSSMRHKERYANKPGFAEKAIERTRKWALDNPERRTVNARRYARKRSHGIGEAAVEILLLDQHGRCACCLGDFTNTPHLDHNHTTGKIRGLLCGPCNRALGMVKDDTKILQRMITYLEKNDG